MRGAFSTLFPYGKADFNMPQSCIVTLAAYAKHILKYQDGRFGLLPLILLLYIQSDYKRASP